MHINLVVARNCSNSCPYCFESSERGEQRQNLITIEKVDELAAWGRASGLQFLSLLGGEPFLHPQLPEIINHLQKASPATSLQILTGGVFKKRLLQTISSQQVGIIFNINEPCDYRNPKHFAKVIGNIEEAIKLGFKVVVGFNVWRIDFDTGFIPTLSYNLGRSGFRWAVANPQLNLHSNVVHTS
ncbi:MAG: radical SAM protein, partial [Dehalococcoidales bacterium]|nr:radical SAM protein [Dehalococcoidales bacterium]